MGQKGHTRIWEVEISGNFREKLRGFMLEGEPVNLPKYISLYSSLIKDYCEEYISWLEAKEKDYDFKKDFKNDMNIIILENDLKGDIKNDIKKYTNPLPLDAPLVEHLINAFSADIMGLKEAKEEANAIMPYLRANKILTFKDLLNLSDFGEKLRKGIRVGLRVEIKRYCKQYKEYLEGDISNIENRLEKLEVALYAQTIASSPLLRLEKLEVDLMGVKEQGEI